MLKISMVESATQCRLVLEGKLIAPWSGELRSEWSKTRTNLRCRELVLDVRNVTTISEDGENVLLEIMNGGAKFRCCGVFTKHVLKQLARRTGRTLQQERR